LIFDSRLQSGIINLRSAVFSGHVRRSLSEGGSPITALQNNSHFPQPRDRSGTTCKACAELYSFTNTSRAVRKPHS
jgi:hypothetical protein